VLIPKAASGLRPLGFSTVGDRIAQMTAKMIVEPRLDALFHFRSFGYRPARGALQAVERAGATAGATTRCWVWT